MYIYGINRQMAVVYNILHKSKGYKNISGSLRPYFS